MRSAVQIDNLKLCRSVQCIADAEVYNPIVSGLVTAE